MPIVQNAHAGAHYALDVEGTPVGSLKAVSGLDMQADIVANDLGPGPTPKKHVAGVAWTPGRATIGLGMGQAMYEWIKQSFDQGPLTQDGTLAVGDFNFKQRSLLAFEDALLTAVTFPRLDGASKESGALDVEFTPRQVRMTKGDGSDIRGAASHRQQAWLCSNFRFELGSLPCARVASIESFTWRCTPSDDSLGIFPEPGQRPAVVTVPDLRLSISAADYDAWAQAAQAWFVDGHHLESDEMSGLITLLTPDLQTPIGAITLGNVGFKRFSQLPASDGTDALWRFTVDLYVERMSVRLLQYEG